MTLGEGGVQRGDRLLVIPGADLVVDAEVQAAGAAEVRLQIEPLARGREDQARAVRAGPREMALVIDARGPAVGGREGVEHLEEHVPPEVPVVVVVGGVAADHPRMGLEPVEGERVADGRAPDLAAAFQDDELVDSIF